MANTDLTIQDIILRYETLSPLTTKGSKLTKSEYDTSLMGIFNDCLRLMTMYDSASWNMADGTAITFGNKTLAAGQIRLFKQNEYISFQIYDGASWLTCLEIQCTDGGGIINRTNYAAYTGGAVDVSVSAAAYAHITNATTDYLSEEIGSEFFAYADDVITVQNLPSGYNGIVKMTVTIEADLDVAATLKVLTREYSFLTVNHTITFTDIFEVENTDELYLQLKKTAGDPATLGVNFMSIDFELINTIAVSP